MKPKDYTGTRTVARKPPSGLSPRVMSPPCERAMSRAMARPKPGAALVLIARVVEPQERLEHFLAHVGRDAGPVVVDSDGQIAVIAMAGDRDASSHGARRWRPGWRGSA